MPNLEDLLSQTMLFSAARGMGLRAVPVPAGPFQTPRPRPQTAEDLGGSLDEETVKRNQIWRFSWDPDNPATFRKVQIYSRGMGMDYRMPMTAFRRIEFSSLRVVRQTASTVDLPMDAAHMLGAWWSHQGAIGDTASGLWQLEARADSSLVVAFGYTLDCDNVLPLTMAEVHELGDTLIPPSELGPRALDFVAGPNSQYWVCVGPVRYIVAVELVLCKENNDFVPGGFLGFARIHPHLFFWSNEDTTRVETTIILERPATLPQHNEAMGSDTKMLLVTDTNVAHDPSASLEVPIPSTDRLYDYFTTEPVEFIRQRQHHDVADGVNHPLQAKNEITFADARHTHPRRIPDAITRRSPLVSADPDILKAPRQGQFDNLHIAPRMNLVLYMPDGSEKRFDDVAMLNTCLHDCTHMHVRWSSIFPDKILKGWKHGRPYAEAGVPLVPENQTVFASFPNSHTLHYRAISEGDSEGQPIVFCHHGLAYAVDAWPTMKAEAGLKMMRWSFERLAREFEEPYWNATPNDEWALFYFRVRYTGKSAKNWVELIELVQERSVFDLETCMA